MVIEKTIMHWQPWNISEEEEDHRQDGQMTLGNIQELNGQMWHRTGEERGRHMSQNG